MHDQSKHAGASLDPTVKQHVVPEVADIAQRQRRSTTSTRSGWMPRPTTPT
jgi:hypothetical protein